MWVVWSFFFYSLLPLLGNDRLAQDAALETLISQTDNQAIAVLDKLIKKNKGTALEPDLWMRRGELFSKKAKSARFFELVRTDLENSVSFIPAVIKDQSSRAALKSANDSYLKIVREFPQYHLADRAAYAYAFNLEQLGSINEAIDAYMVLVNRYPKSKLVDDSWLALGEIYFSRGNFNKALELYERVSNNVKSKTYWYAEYKKAWVLYNLKDARAGMRRLEQIIKNEGNYENKLALQEEAIKDLALFYSDAGSPEEAYSYFTQLPVSREVALSALQRLSAIYTRHSKFAQAVTILEDILAKEKNPEVLAKYALALAQVHSSIKHYAEANQALSKAYDHCARIEFKSESCAVELEQLHAKQIKDLWDENKKRPKKETAKLLEDQLRLAIKTSPSPEAKAKHHGLLGDFLFGASRFKEAAESYQKAFDTHPKEIYLLGVIDARIEEYKGNGSSDALLKSIDLFIKQYPQHERINALRIKRLALHLERKNLDSCREDVDWLGKQKLNSELYSQFQDLELEYLKQRGDLVALSKKSKEYQSHEKDPERRKQFGKIAQLSELKILEKKILEAKARDQRKQELEVLIQYLEKNELDQHSLEGVRSLLLQALDIAKAESLLFTLIKLGEIFLERYPNDSKDYEVRALLLKSSFDLADLRRTKKYSYQLLRHKESKNKNQLITSIIELEEMMGDQKSFVDFLNSDVSQLPEKELSALLQHLYAKTPRESPSYSVIVNKIKQGKIEPIFSELQLEEVTDLLAKKRYEEAFQQSKKFMGSQYPKAIRAKARLIQARIFERELTSVGFRVSQARAPLVVEIKVERLEKAQKAYEDVLSWSSSDSAEYLEALSGTERILGDFLVFVDNFVIKDAGPAEAEAIKQQLQVAAEPFRKKLVSLREDIEKVRKSNKSQPAHTMRAIYDWEVEDTIPPQLDQGIHRLFPELVDGRSASCRSDQEKICLALKKSHQEFEKWLDKNEGSVTFEAGELAYYRSFEAARNKRWSEAIYLLQLAQQLNPKNHHVTYQLGRVLIEKGDLRSGINYLYQVYLHQYPVKELDYVHVIDGYLQNNCAKALAFVPQGSVPSEAGTYLYPIVAECMSQSHQIDEALKLLQQKLKDHFSKWLQVARIQERYRQDWASAIQSYEKALKTAPDPQTKDWLKNKMAYLRAQVKSQGTDEKLRGASQ